MKISVKVKARAKESKIEKTGDNRFEVWVKEPPIKGKANKAVCQAVAEYFGVPLAKVKIVSGASSRQKIIEIL